MPLASDHVSCPTLPPALLINQARSGASTRRRWSTPPRWPLLPWAVSGSFRGTTKQDSSCQGGSGLSFHSVFTQCNCSKCSIALQFALPCVVPRLPPPPLNAPQAPYTGPLRIAAHQQPGCSCQVVSNTSHNLLCVMSLRSCQAC